jgi:hypothetical protein
MNGEKVWVLRGDLDGGSPIGGPPAVGCAVGLGATYRRRS